jgi:hypothetical protein
MTIEDVVVARSSRTAPDVSCMETTTFHVSEILDENGVVSCRTIALRFKVLHRVQVRNVNPTLVRSRTLVSIFVDVHREQKCINSVYLLEKSNAL